MWYIPLILPMNNKFSIFHCVEYCVCYWLFVRFSCYKNVKFKRWKWNWLITSLLLVLLAVTTMATTCFVLSMSSTSKELLQIKNKMLTINKLLHGSSYNMDIFSSFKDFLLLFSSPKGLENNSTENLWTQKILSILYSEPCDN